MLHLAVPGQQEEMQDILAPTIADWTADMQPQTITHSATGCIFRAFPLEHEGIVVPFGRRQIAVRFLGMMEKKPKPSVDEIIRLRNAGDLVDRHLYDGIATPHARRMIMSDHARAMTDEQIAASLEYQAALTTSALARAVMQEAARRLRGDAGAAVLHLPTVRH
jgi:hypothetical protein